MISFRTLDYKKKTEHCSFLRIKSTIPNQHTIKNHATKIQSDKAYTRKPNSDHKHTNSHTSLSFHLKRFRRRPFHLGNRGSSGHLEQRAFRGGPHILRPVPRSSRTYNVTPETDQREEFIGSVAELVPDSYVSRYRPVPVFESFNSIVFKLWL